MPMMEFSNPNPTIKDVVLVGGGHAHVHVVKALGMRPIPGVAVTLIAKSILTPYSGMLPGYVAGHYTFDQCHIDLYNLCQFAGATLINASCVGLDTEARTLTCDDGRPPIRYDVCSIDVGSTPTLPMDHDLDNVLKSNMGITPIKPIDNFNERWTGILQRVEGENWEERGSLKIVVVGGGAGGVEVCLAIQHRLRKIKEVSIVLVSKGNEVGLGCTRQTRSFLKKVLQDRGVELKVGKGALGIKQNDDGTRVLLLEDGIEVPYHELIWCTQGNVPAWFKTTNLSLTSNGFIEVDDYIQSTNTPGVFACGDCAVMKNNPRPKAGVFAVRQGPPLVKNIRLMLKGRPLTRYHPQKRFLGLISIGNKYAIVSRVAMPAIRGKWVWAWKDRIDVKFMKKFQDLPDMSNKSTKIPIAAVVAGPEATAIIEHASMRCGGCGSKIGNNILTRVLRRLGLQKESGPEDAAIVYIPAGEGISVVQTVDYFRTCLQDPFLLGRIATVHALSDIYAMGATPICACINVVIPYAGEAQVEYSLLHVMSGVMVSLDEAGCLLADGHTSEGHELAIGLTATGVVRTAEILTKGGMKPGDRLILTKAIGTGVIFAGAMRGKAHAHWIQGAIKVMTATNAPASKVFVNAGANTVTDVTGFGLVGHLVEMIQATGNKAGGDQCSNCDGNGVERSCEGDVKVELDILSVPVLQGALECFRLEVESTLQPSNMKVGKYVECYGLERSDPLHSILYDPQTSGGLLASVPAQEVEICLDALPGAVVIGKVVHASAWDGPSLIKVQKKTQP